MFTYWRAIKCRRIRRRLQTRSPTPLLGLIYCRRLNARRSELHGRTAACHVDTRRRRAFLFCKLSVILLQQRSEFRQLGHYTFRCGPCRRRFVTVAPSSSLTYYFRAVAAQKFLIGDEPKDQGSPRDFLWSFVSLPGKT